MAGKLSPNRRQTLTRIATSVWALRRDWGRLTATECDIGRGRALLSDGCDRARCCPAAHRMEVTVSECHFPGTLYTGGESGGAFAGPPRHADSKNGGDASGTSSQGSPFGGVWPGGLKHPPPFPLLPQNTPGPVTAANTSDP